MKPPIEIVAAVIRDDAGRMLLVRKHGTAAFMQPGGKRQPGEDDLTALARELQEELGCRMVRDGARSLGSFDAPAANEPNRRVRAALYEVAVNGPARPLQEIEEIAWIDDADRVAIPLAPLTRDHVLPRIARRATDGARG